MALCTGIIRIWRLIQDGDSAVSLTNSSAPRFEIVLLDLNRLHTTTRRTQLVGHEEIEKECGETPAAATANEVMVCEVHSAPIEHANVHSCVLCSTVLKLGDEECPEGCPASVEAGEGAKDVRGSWRRWFGSHRRQRGVDASEAAKGVGDVMGGGGEAVDDFVPGGQHKAWGSKRGHRWGSCNRGSCPGS